MKLLLFSLLICQSAFAGNNAQTLPKGIFGIRLNNVFVTGTDYEFGNDGGKATVGDIHATSIKGAALQQATGFGLGQGIVAQIAGILANSGLLSGVDLGEMKMDVASTSTVFNPTLMYGLTNRWTLIVNAPYVNIKYDIKWNYVPGASTAALDAAASIANLANLNVPTSSQFVTLAQQELARKGYKAMQSREKTFMGDVLLMNMFSLGKVGRLSFGAMNTLNLPTGPKHDPDDLLDVGSFHHTYMEQEFTAVYAFSKKLQTYASASVRYNLEEKTTFRVPVNENDLAPEKNQTEDIKRQVGTTKFAEAGFKYRLLPRFVLTTGAAYKTRDADKFSGSKGSNYSAMSKIYPYTAESATLMKLGLTYDPLSNYRPGSIPLMTDISYEEVFSGRNTPAIKQMILSVSTFF